MNFPEIKSINQFLDIVEEERLKGMLSFTPYFRGEISDSFVIRPNIARITSSVSELEELEKGHFNNVLNSLSSNPDYFTSSSFTGYQNEWFLLYQAQHLGIPTRLMDWTIKPEVALFFAVWDKQKLHLNSNSRIWVLKETNPIQVSNDEFEEKNSIFNMNQPVFTNPPFIFLDDMIELNKAQQNRVQQYGRFLVQSPQQSMIPLDQGIFKDALTKYIIPAKYKVEIFNELKRKGISEETLFA